ncbi:MAG: hypothetical protein KBH11_12660 [Bacteroidia bacterium]|nr:hypothetical protein [Bacteroidia bacterium]
MKKSILSILLFSGILLSAKGQEARLNLYGGYVFDDNLDAYYETNQYVNGLVNGGFQYGGSIEFLTPEKVGIELMYIGHNTTFPISFNAGFSSGPRVAENDLNLNYALVGINKYSDSDGKLEGYGGLLLGALFSNAKNTSISDSSGARYVGTTSSATRFSWGLKLGANIWVKPNIGIKVQTQFLSTTQGVGESAYYGYYGTYYGYATYVNMFQWSFSSGLVFKLNSQK